MEYRLPLQHPPLKILGPRNLTQVRPRPRAVPGNPVKSQETPGSPGGVPGESLGSPGRPREYPGSPRGVPGVTPGDLKEAPGSP